MAAPYLPLGLRRRILSGQATILEGRV